MALHSSARAVHKELQTASARPDDAIRSVLLPLHTLCCVRRAVCVLLAASCPLQHRRGPFGRAPAHDGPVRITARLTLRPIAGAKAHASLSRPA